MFCFGFFLNSPKEKTLATKKKKIKKPSRIKPILKWTTLGGVTLLALGLLGGGAYAYNKLQDLPDIDTQYLKNYETSKITDAKGNTIWQSTSRRSKSTTYKEIEPTLLDDGLVAVEDEKFWETKGFSTEVVIKTLVGYAYSKLPFVNYTPRGGSGLEQQTIKNAYYNGGVGVDTLTRKVQELFLAKQFNENYNKEEIFEMYVNMIEYAEGDKGLAAIAKTYFGKEISDYKTRNTENIAQQAYLVGLGQAPSEYNIYENPEQAEKRKNIVLGVFLESGIINKKEYDDAKDFKLTTNLKPRYWESEEQRAKNVKYKVYTDVVLQEVKEMGYNIDDITINISTFLDPETFDAITAKVREDQYYQDGAGGTEQSAATVINKDGIVIGMVGGRYEGDELNRATQMSRSSGSSMKPFTAYGPLIEYFGNQYNTASVFSTAPYQYPGSTAVMNNYGGFTYGNQTIQYALRMSLNTVVGRIADEILGPDRMKTFLHGLGLDVQQTYSSVDAIGINISTLQAAAAYNAINNGGIYTEPRFINYLEFTDGSKKTVEAKRSRTMNESTAFILSQMLRGTLQPNMSAPEAAISEYAGYAGKTGSVAFDASSAAYNMYGEGGSDIWYDSITRDGYSISVWFGYDKPNESPQLADSFEGHQWLGRDLQRMLNGNKNVPNWDKPATVTTLGGSGINANYAATDSKDIAAKINSVQVNQISDNYEKLGNITEVKTDEKDESKWSQNLKGKEKSFHDLYNKDNRILDNLSIISKNLYNLLED